MRLDTVLFLGGLALLLVFLALEPFLSYALFGSDTGEYYRLTVDLVSTGSIPHGAAYAGWGSAYPDFPGIYLIAGAGAGALGAVAAGAAFPAEAAAAFGSSPSRASTAMS